MDGPRTINFEDVEDSGDSDSGAGDGKVSKERSGGTSGGTRDGG